MAHLYWITDGQWAVIAPFMPQNHLGLKRKEDHQIISGNLYVPSSGCRWRDCPGEYGKRIMVYSRFNR